MAVVGAATHAGDGRALPDPLSRKQFIPSKATAATMARVTVRTGIIDFISGE